MDLDCADAGSLRDDYVETGHHSEILLLMSKGNHLLIEKDSHFFSGNSFLSAIRLSVEKSAFITTPKFRCLRTD